MRSTSRIPSKDLTREDASLCQATSPYSTQRKNQMDAQLLVVVGKRTQLPQSHVLVPASLIELPANTWANMITYLEAQS